MPTDSGMAFVLVQHLDPGHASALAEIIGASTTMPVEQAKTGDVLAPDRVFVIPPDSILTNVGDRGRRQPAGAASHSCAARKGDVVGRGGAEKTLVRMLRRDARADQRLSEAAGETSAGGRRRQSGPSFSLTHPRKTLARIRAEAWPALEDARSISATIDRAGTALALRQPVIGTTSPGRRRRAPTPCRIHSPQ